MSASGSVIGSGVVAAAVDHAIEMQRGGADGLAPLDGDERIPQGNLPAHLDPNALAAEVTAQTGAPILLPEPNGTDDTAAIQAAANAASAQAALDITGKTIVTVLGRAGRTYQVQQSGTIALRNTSGSLTTAAAYCVKIPPGAVIDFAGSVVRLNGGDVRMFVNANPAQAMGTVSDHDLGLRNVTLDCGGQQFSAAQAVTLNGCSRAILDNLRLTNGKGGGVLVYNDEGGFYDRLTADAWSGNAYNFGNPFPGTEMRRARIGSIRGFDIGADTVAPSSFPGNLLYACLVRSSLSFIECLNAAGGIKLDAGSDITVGDVIYKGGPLATANSGFKVQGFDGTHKVKRISVANVVAQGCEGSGMYIDQHTEDVTVMSYTGEGNAASGASPDVWLSGARNRVGSLRSNNAGGQAVLVRAEAADWSVDTLSVYNPNTSAAGNAVSVTSTGVGVIGRLNALDDRGAGAKMNRALSVDSVAAVVEVGSMDIRGAVVYPITSVSASVTFGPLRCHASDPLTGLVTLAAGTSTTVTNGNLRNDAFSVYYRPVVRLTPMNGAARTLVAAGQVYAVPALGSMSIKHGAAAGTEIFRWEVIAYIRENHNLT